MGIKNVQFHFELELLAKYCPGNKICSGHGVCDSTTGTCNCSVGHYGSGCECK